MTKYEVLGLKAKRDSPSSFRDLPDMEPGIEIVRRTKMRIVLFPVQSSGYASPKGPSTGTAYRMHVSEGNGKLLSEIRVLPFFWYPSLYVFHDKIALFAKVGTPFGKVAGDEAVDTGDAHELLVNKCVSPIKISGLFLVDESPKFDDNGI